MVIFGKIRRVCNGRTNNTANPLGQAPND
jgi:hypothetical protein